MFMAKSHFLQLENQVIKREEENGQNLRSNCERKWEKCKIKLSYTWL